MSHVPSSAPLDQALDCQAPASSLIQLYTSPVDTRGTCGAQVVLHNRQPYGKIDPAVLCRVQRRTSLEFLKASLPSYTRSEHACHMCEGFISLDRLPALARFAYKAIHPETINASPRTFYCPLYYHTSPARYCLLLCPLIFSSNPIMTACSTSKLKVQAAAMRSSHALFSTCVCSSGMYAVQSAGKQGLHA